MALALSPVVRALVDPDGALRDIRNLDSHGGNILVSKTIPAPSVHDVLSDGATQINIR